MMEEVHDKLTAHDREIARQGEAIQSLVHSTNELSNVVRELPQQINAGLANVYKRLDRHEVNTRPDMRLITTIVAGVATFFLSVFSIIMGLTHFPLSKRVDDTVRYGISPLYDQSREQGERISALEAQIK